MEEKDQLHSQEDLQEQDQDEVIELQDEEGLILDLEEEAKIPVEPDQIEDNSDFKFTGHQDHVYSVNTHPKDVNIIVSSDGANKVLVWNLFTQEILATLANHSDTVITAKFNCDGSQLATCSLDNTMNIYTTTPPSTSSTSNPSPSFTFLHKLEGPSEEILFLHWHHTHAMILLCGGYDKLIWMLNTSTGTILNAFSCHSDIISDGGFTPSGKAIYSSSHDNTLHITHPSTGKFKTINSIKPLRGVINTCLCDISRFLIIAATTQGSLFFANYQTLKVLAEFDVGEECVESLDFSDGFGLAACGCGGDDGLVVIFDLSPIQKRVQVALPNAGVVKIQFSAVDFRLFAACLDGCVYELEARSGEILRILKGHSQPILDFTISLDNKYLITCGDDKLSLIFNLHPKNPQLKD